MKEENEKIEIVTMQITKMVEQKWIESEDESYNILLSLLKSDPKKYAEVFYFFKMYERLCSIDRRVRQIETNTRTNNN